MKSANSLSWAGWTKTEKPVDRERPFHRINSPTMGKGTKATGRGYDCGCRVNDDIPTNSLFEDFFNLIGKDLRKLIRTVPSWVPVRDQALRVVNEPQELEGVLIRSFQTWTDFPMFQWHRWYDWNFIVIPSPACTYLKGGANTPTKIPDGDDKKAGFTQPAIRDFNESGAVTGAATMECEFDCGLFGSRFTDKRTPPSFGPMFEADWAWPMAGQLLWARGKWIYDCGHPTSDVKTGPNAGLARSELL